MSKYLLERALQEAKARLDKLAAASAAPEQIAKAKAELFARQDEYDRFHNAVPPVGLHGGKE